MDKLYCTIYRIIYRCADNGYTVFSAQLKDEPRYVTLVGTFCNEGPGTELVCIGEWVMNKTHGKQFSVHTYQVSLPTTLKGVEAYLGSGVIKGIGPRLARIIVNAFGVDVIDILDENIDRLVEVHGIGKKKLKKIKENWQESQHIRYFMMYLFQFGVSAALANRIYRHYGPEGIQVIKENPYRLADDVWGVGFATADQMAQKMSYAPDDPRRCQCGIVHALKKLSEDGHVYAEKERLVDAAVELLQFEDAPVIPVLQQMIEGKRLIMSDKGIYLPQLYYAETAVAEGLARLNAYRTNSLFKVDIDSIEKRTGIKYDEIQVQAIRQAAASKVMVLTGGPGTGKTTTVQGIIGAYQDMGMRIVLCAPTGRAAKRMSEATGMEAKTIHRLLEYSPNEGWGRNEDNPLTGDVVIVDECSMIDIVLMAQLVKALPNYMRLVMVGDIDQLPSVGPGNVLRDIIDSRHIRVIRLTRVFRQAQQSRIVMNAHAINQGRLPDLSNGGNTDFFFLAAADAEQARNVIVGLVKDRLPAAYRLPVNDIQVLSPMKQGPAGTEVLNQALQQALNPKGESVKAGTYGYRAGDRIMQVRNNYEKGVFNGDLGYVVAVDAEERTLRAEFEGRIIDYESMEITEELTLAYATTIHKSQGSEYPVVVIPVLKAHFIMLQRNLIYTAITRAKKICILVGDKEALSMAVRNMAVLRRNTLLKERLNPAWQPVTVPVERLF